MDLIALGIMLVGLAIAVAICSGNPIAWARREWRLMRAKTWEPGREKVVGGTVEEESCKRLLRRQLALAKHMRKRGRHLYAGKRYRPALTSPSAPAIPPKAGKVVRPDFHNKDRRKNSAP